MKPASVPCRSSAQCTSGHYWKMNIPGSMQKKLIGRAQLPGNLSKKLHISMQKVSIQKKCVPGPRKS